MSKWPGSWRAILLLLLSGIFAGCLPISESQLDEEKDPNFIEGRNHQNAMDYKAAIAAFERAVQANPRNAAAHFELGLLYEQKMNDYVSAIYHYQKHLQLRPKSNRIDVLDPRIRACKLELAKTVTFDVVTAEVHRDMAKLTNEISLLNQQNATLRAHLATKPMVLTQWMTLRVTNLVNVPQRITNYAPQYIPPPTNVVARPVATNPVARRPANAVRAQVPVPAPRENRASALRATRVHQVRAGETMSAIARRHSISMERLQAANPRVSAKQLRPGQTLYIPTTQ